MKRNLTVQLDEATIEKAKAIAARRNTSVSRLVADIVEQLTNRDEAYQRSAATIRRHLARGFDLGGGPYYAEREELYDRKPKRRPKRSA